ncbi:MAG: hypothetical protein IKW80_09940 [Thermoguttaceae bacterium]|nr:hypothetical protein [Thermoguttaceae bacterium]
MTLQQTIHDVWKTNSTLEKRIPSEFLTYNYSPFERLPRAAFLVKDQAVVARTNQGVAAEKATVEFIVLETSCAGALDDLNQIIELYDGKTFDLVTDEKTVSFALVESNVTHDNNHWIADIVFDAKIIH